MPNGSVGQTGRQFVESVSRLVVAVVRRIMRMVAKRLQAKSRNRPRTEAPSKLFRKPNSQMASREAQREVGNEKKNRPLKP